MHILNLANANRPFFQHQLEVLEREGVACTTMMVPGREGAGDTRSMLDYLQFWPRAYREFDDRYDIVHANYGLLGPIAISQRRLPVVLTLWGTDLFGPYSWVSRAVEPFCDAVIVMSEEMAAEFDRECDVIPHGVDLDQFQPQPRQEARNEVGWAHDEFHVLFPYRPEREEKNYPLANRVVNAVDEILAEPVTLEVVSGVSHEMFPQYVNASDCLLLTSKYEGSPNAVKEALACNLPVVSTDVGDVRKRLEDVEPSAVCQSEAELVTELLKVLRRAEPSNGREAAQDVSLESMGQQLLAVYERVLEEHDSPGSTVSNISQTL